MEKLTAYRQYVQAVLNRYREIRMNASIRPEMRAVAANQVYDTERDRYMIVIDGWVGDRRDYGCVMHLDIKSQGPDDVKIWIQYNGTEIDLVQQLLDFGVPKQDIVLGYYAPSFRPFTEFALG